MRKFLSLFLAATIAVLCLGFWGESASAVSINYREEAAVVKVDGGYMVVYSAMSKTTVYALYYDNDGNYLDTREISCDGRKYRDFLALGDYYYVASVVTNWDELPDLEVIRIAKYDKDWNKVGTCSIKDCNSISIGTLTMTGEGHYLIGRGGHTMYQSDDGYNHQANYTFQIDIDTMKMTDGQFDVSNVGYGYVSHSLNQFVRIDGGKIVGLDRGDTYPDGIVLCIYPKKVSGGTFQSSVSHVMITNDCTETTPVGFECSSSSYLVLCEKNGDLTLKTVNKNSKAITDQNIASGVSEARLVKVRDDLFCIMYSDYVSTWYSYYDASGKRTEEVFKTDLPITYLSDMSVIGNKILWTDQDRNNNIHDTIEEGLHDNGKIYSIWADPEVAREKIGGFVDRLYSVCLGRPSDPAGKKFWVNDLLLGNVDGITAAYGFVFSPEFNDKNLCNSDYIESLYIAFMDRAPDPTGKAYWLDQLASGAKREEVFNGFATSPEFTAICRDYGIIRGDAVPVPSFGTVPTGPCSICGEESNISKFVNRMYDVCLDRAPDKDGHDYWVDVLASHKIAGDSCARFFIFSDEFKARGFNDSEYVEHLYAAFFGRPSDPAGLEFWCNSLKTQSREDVFEGFVKSPEFEQICNSYGIARSFG